ncbi:hypothetical protein B0H14DRAFT_3531468 [Mycena olivaceomarginata]|nr:hypothetical protein B0H14DRAFT_3531468 [Mycena olivaceomarginata]
MKRSNNGTQSKKKRAKNTFSLASFGHSLKPSNAVRAGKLTADGRRADIRVVPIQRERTPVPPSPAPEDEWVDMQVDDEPPADSRPPRKRKWYATTDDNLRHWVANYRDEYLRVLVTREGLLGEEPFCSCGQPASYRDIDFVPFVLGKQEEARQKHVSLASFGHSLKPSNAVRAGKLTADGRRADIRVVPIQRERTPVPPSPAPEDEWVDMQVDDEPPADSRPPRKRKWYATTDDNLRHWVANYRDEYLRVLVTREGLLGEEPFCSCGQPASYRDIDFVPFVASRLGMAHSLTAKTYASSACGCSLDTPTTDHALTLTRGGRISWSSRRTATTPLQLTIVNVDAVAPSLTGSNFSPTAGTPRLPIILRVPSLSLPSSSSTPSAFKGKTTAYHFFNALAKLTDNTGGTTFKCRYQLALRVVRQWRNLRALKRGGMGNDPDRRTAETHEGELAVECLACPKAGVNLPEGWEKAPVEVRFLYCIFLAIDACFRLKRKKISSWLADPSIQDGWAYFTRSVPYGEFLETLGEQKEMSTCTGLAALDHANTKYAQGYAATGCGMITCGRHEIVCKNGVGDLQAGEKYGNMDYIVASAWRHLRDLLFFLLSYDIMCQWMKNLRERLLKLPPALRFQLAHYFVKFVIPKLHILGHLKFCQDFFSLLYTLGSAQADMEGIERIWSSSGLMGASTREMGPGSRQDTLDDFWHYWNWNKVVGMGTTLRSRLLKARKELTRQEEGLQEFTAAQEGEAPAWKEAVDAFEAGASTDNPYQLPHAGPTLRDVELELMHEEQERERRSSAALSASDDTLTEYLMLGLEIEGQQRQLAADLLANRNPTSKELTDFVTRRTRVSRQIKKLRLMQRIYSPGALQRLATAADPAEPVESERAPLFLPSGLSPAQAAAPLSVSGLALAEARLRDGQCSESLEAIRHGLTNTRSRSLVDNQQQKIDLAARTYRQARAARLALVYVAGECGWRALEKEDLRLPEDEEEAKRRKQRAMKGKRKEAAQVNENGEVRGVPGMGEKTRLVSWIWYGAGNTEGAVGETMHDSVRVEWSKAYARVKRWREETRLLQEEMARCLLTLEWQAARWDERAVSTHYNGRIQYSAAHLQGAMALAARQAAVRRRLARRFRRCWWRLSDRVAPPQMGDSGQLSAEDVDGDEDRDGDEDEDEDGAGCTGG